MKLMHRIANLFQKQSEARIALSLNKVGQPLVSPNNYGSFAKEGYNKNVIAFRCISMIAKACAGIQWEVYQKQRSGDDIEVENSPLLTLINRPNPMQGRSAFFESMISYFVMTGNTFVEQVSPSERYPPMELWTNRPDKMRIVPNSNGYPLRYEFAANGVVKKWELNPVTLQSAIIHMKTFNPLDEWFGMSPLESAMLSLDQNNQSNKWNLALLQNSATPSGVLKVKSSDSNPSGSLSDEQYIKLKESFYESYQGSRNAGRPLILEGGLDWQAIAFSPKDMEFLQSKSVTAIEIAIAFGVPPEMLGLGQKTFANYKEARLSFYEETILPIMDFIQTEFNNNLTPRFGDGIYLQYDKDDIEALAEKRDLKYATVKDANYLTQNEKRNAVGYESMEGWDVFIIGNQAVETPDQLTQQGFGSSIFPPAQVNGTPIEPTPPIVPPELNPPIDSETEIAGDFRGLEIKQINLVNKNEKIQAWKKLNRKRDSYLESFSHDLKDDFTSLASKLYLAAVGKPPKLAEFAMIKEVNEFMPTIKNTLERHIKYIVYDFGKSFFNQYKKVGGSISVKASSSWDYWAQDYISKRSGNAVGQIEGATTKKVQSVVKRLTEAAVIDGNSDYDMAQDLQNHFEGLSDERAILIARTETGMASNNATLEAAKDLEVPTLIKEWVSVQDTRTRDGGKHGNEANHLDMNGTQIGLDEKFSVPPDATMDGPGDESAGPEQLCNCRCVLVFSNRGE